MNFVLPFSPWNVQKKREISPIWQIIPRNTKKNNTNKIQLKNCPVTSKNWLSPIEWWSTTLFIFAFFPPKLRPLSLTASCNRPYSSESSSERRHQKSRTRRLCDWRWTSSSSKSSWFPSGSQEGDNNGESFFQLNFLSKGGCGEGEGNFWQNVTLRSFCDELELDKSLS